MKNNFDDFLKSEIIKSEIKLKDDGFSDMVIHNLPGRKYNYFNRNIILLVSAIISFVVFMLVNGINHFITGLYTFIGNLLKYGTLNYEFIFVILAFSCLLLSIPALEFKRRIF